MRINLFISDFISHYISGTVKLDLVRNKSRFIALLFKSNYAMTNNIEPYDQYRSIHNP